MVLATTGKGQCIQRRMIIPCIIITSILVYFGIFLSYLSDEESVEESSLNLAVDQSIDIDTQQVIDTQHVIDTQQKKIKCSILVAHGGDDGAGFATLIYAYPINFILYAQRYNYTLWLDYIPSYNDLYYEKKYGRNCFEYFFDGIKPNWNLCDKKKSKYKILKKLEINPGIHKKEKSSIHLWYYHFGIQHIKFDRKQYLNNWYYNQRLIGSQIVNKYFHLKPDIIKQRDEIWNSAFPPNNNYEIMGIQMRGSDKVQPWSIRRTVSPLEYMPYISSFIEYYKHNAKIFFATDDKNYLKFLNDNWSKYVNKEYNFNDIVVTQENVIRSDDETAIFDFKNVSKYRIGREVLLDILLLAKCDWFIHAASAVSEAVFFNNIKLHNYSVHLEYTKDRQIPFWFNETIF